MEPCQAEPGHGESTQNDGALGYGSGPQRDAGEPRRTCSVSSREKENQTVAPVMGRRCEAGTPGEASTVLLMASATPSGSTNRPGWWFGLSAKSTTVTPSGKGSPGVVRQSGLQVRAPPVSEPDRVFATVSLSRIADAAFAKIDILGLSVSQLVRPPPVPVKTEHVVVGSGMDTRISADSEADGNQVTRLAAQQSGERAPQEEAGPASQPECPQGAAKLVRAELCPFGVRIPGPEPDVLPGLVEHPFQQRRAAFGGLKVEGVDGARGDTPEG